MVRDSTFSTTTFSSDTNLYVLYIDQKDSCLAALSSPFIILDVCIFYLQGGNGTGECVRVILC
jgi:hypothetical protein